MATKTEERSGSANPGTLQTLTSAASHNDTPSRLHPMARPIPPALRPFQFAAARDLEKRARHWHQAARLAASKGDVNAESDAKWHLSLVQEELHYRAAHLSWLRLDRERRSRDAMELLLARRKAGRL